MELPQLLTVRQVALVLSPNVTFNECWYLIQKGIIPSLKVGRRRFVRKVDLLDQLTPKQTTYEASESTPQLLGK